MDVDERTKPIIEEFDDSVPEEVKAENKRFCDKFPFLIPSNRWSGKKINSGEKGFWPGNPEEMPEWDYDYTELDSMPDGWRKAFGEQMCEEILEELKANNFVDDYRIVQIKEKYGGLRWYDDGFTKKGYEIIRKYEDISERICIKCGKPATKISMGWICPWCDECAEGIGGRFVPIEKYFNEDQSND